MAADDRYPLEVRFKTFESSFRSWTKLLQQAADFASSLPAGALINISHSADHNTGVVVVWYSG